MRSSMMVKTSIALLALANVLLPISLLTFAIGFFPYKPFIPGTNDAIVGVPGLEPPKAPFDKVVFMVVDALRRYLYCHC